MSNDEKVPPALPGEVWRGVDIDGDPTCVTYENEKPSTFWWSNGRWIRHEDIGGPVLGEEPMAGWALAERTRADKAEAIASAERALRKAEQREWEAWEAVQGNETDETSCRELGAAEMDAERAQAAIRALGVEP